MAHQYRMADSCSLYHRRPRNVRHFFILEPMKMTDEMIDRIVDFVAENGLQDYGGCQITRLCEHFNISRETFYRMMGNVTFMTRINEAKEIFRNNMTANIVNSLYKSATGYEYEKKHAETITDKNGNKRQKARAETINVPPNVQAGIFLLTNIAPDKWQNRQNVKQDVNANVDATVKQRYSFDDVDDDALAEFVDKMQDAEHERVTKEQYNG